MNLRDWILELEQAIKDSSYNLEYMSKSRKFIFFRSTYFPRIKNYWKLILLVISMLYFISTLDKRVAQSLNLLVPQSKRLTSVSISILKSCVGCGKCTAKMFLSCVINWASLRQKTDQELWNTWLNSCGHLWFYQLAAVSHQNSDRSHLDMTKST